MSCHRLINQFFANSGWGLGTWAANSFVGNWRKPIWMAQLTYCDQRKACDTRQWPRSVALPSGLMKELFSDDSFRTCRSRSQTHARCLKGKMCLCWKQTAPLSLPCLTPEAWFHRHWAWTGCLCQNFSTKLSHPKTRKIFPWWGWGWGRLQMYGVEMEGIYLSGSC